MEDGRLNLARGGGGVRDVSGRRLQRGRAGLANIDVLREMMQKNTQI